MRVLNSLKQNVKRFNIQTMSPKEEHRLFLYFLCGVVLGTLMINIFGTSYEGNIDIYSSYLVGNSLSNDAKIDTWNYMMYCFKSYIGEFGIVFLFNLTPFGKVFNSLYLCVKGLTIGLLIAAATLAYGVGGLFLYIVSIFPHYIAYIPYVVCAIYVSIKLSERLKNKDKRLNLKAILIVIVLALITSLLEAYANYPILKLIYG